MPLKKPRVKLICEHCVKPFELLPSQIERGRGKFCSKECYSNSMQKGSTLQCSWCDTTFYRAASEQLRADTYFCSIECYQEHRSSMTKSTTYKKDGARHAHRIVAERILCRSLAAEEVVHHIDFDKHNNDPANLAVIPDRRIHNRIHHGLVSDEELNSYRLVRHV